MPPRARLTPFSLLFLALCPGACRAPEREREERVVFRAQHGHFEDALEQARRLSDANPEDPQLQRLARDAEIALILHRGRQEVFRGELSTGLQYFDRAAQLDPDNVTVQSWIAKTHAQLAEEWLDRAAELKGPTQLDEAEQAYERVLEHAPDNEDARRGLAHVLLLKNYRSGLSRTYFEDGISTFRLLFLEQARRNFQVSRRYQENEPAAMRGGQVESLLAEDRLAQAQGLEAAGLYFAARSEYRLVLLIEPDNAEGRAGLDRMDREVRAAHSLTKADMAMRRGELEDAKETLIEAEQLTVAQADDVTLLQAGIEEKRLSDMYLEARSLTDDYRYPEAVLAYERLLALAPDYQDAVLRKATLEEFIRLAEDFYTRALEAPTDEEAEGWLRSIHPVVWPEYRDVVQLLEAIEARRAAREKTQPPEQGGG